MHTNLNDNVSHACSLLQAHRATRHVSTHFTPLFVLMWLAPLLGSAILSASVGRGGGGDADWKCGITNLCFVWPIMV